MKIISKSIFILLIILTNFIIKDIYSFEISKKEIHLNKNQYYNFDLLTFKTDRWQEFHEIEFEIENNSQAYFEFFFSLADKNSVNYWTQLNHKTTVAPGNNIIVFDLEQLIGERGSTQNFRKIDLKNIKKAFVVFDPDNKTLDNGFFKIKRIKLLKKENIAKDKSIYAIDFNLGEKKQNSQFISISSNSLLNSNNPNGFKDTKFWRSEDDVYAPETLKSSIGVLSGEFHFTLPNGIYEMNLIIDRLGFWDVPFWQNRTIYAQGKPIFKETRTFYNDYLQDLLIFENEEPQANIDIFETYLKKIFKPIQKQFVVSNNKLVLSFEGDASGINLNRLIIWPITKSKEANEFLSNLKKQEKFEFKKISREIKWKNSNPKSKISLIKKSLKFEKILENQFNIKFSALTNERPFHLFYANIKGEEFINVKIVNDPRNKIKINNDVFKSYYLTRQLQSLDSNHETYFINDSQLNELSSKGEKLTGPYRILMTQFILNNKLPVGVYQGDILFEFGKEKIKCPFEFEIFNEELPEIDFPVGFLGLDPLPYSYFPGQGYFPIINKLRLKALSLIKERGFTSFSGLPEAILIHNNDSSYNIDANQLKDFINQVKNMGFKGPLFSYSGQFPGSILSQFENKDLYKISQPMNEILKELNIPVIYTFSDEAGGYSNKIAEDYIRSLELKKYFPSLKLGGFTQSSNELSKLNKSLDYPLFSHVQENDASNFKNWCFYNQSQKLLDDPRFAFGLGLFLARKEGLKCYFDWHFSSHNNYPYYPLDGRENDVNMVYVKSNLELQTSLKFEFATLGLEQFRKLILLENLSRQKNKFYKFQQFLDRIRINKNVFSERFYANQLDLDKLDSTINEELKVMLK
jgi:hypothetical protein